MGNTSSSTNPKAIFLDRDNTLIHNDGDLGDPRQVRLIRGAAYAIGSLRQLGFQIVVVSNQGGVARGNYTEAEVQAVNSRINRLVCEALGASLGVDRFYYCPFHPEGSVPQYAKEHPWRKPQPGMLLQAAADLGLTLRDCWMIGDQERDIEAGLAAECQTILIAKDEVKTRAHFRAINLAEAASIIAQNRVRGRGLREAVSGTLANHKALFEVAGSAVPADATLSVLDQPSTLSGPTSGSKVSGTEPRLPSSTMPVEAKSMTLAAREPVNVITAPSGKPVFIYGGPPNVTEAVLTPTRTTTQIPHQTATRPLPGTQINASQRQNASGDLKSPSSGPPEDRAMGTSPIESPLRTSAVADDRAQKLMAEILGELHAIRQRPHEFTAGDMASVLIMLAIAIGGVAAAIYLDQSSAGRWLIVALLSQLTVIGFVLLTRRR